MWFCGIHLRATSQWVPKLLVCIMSMKIMLLKLLPHLPGANELREGASVATTSILSFLTHGRMQKVEILPHGRQGPDYHGDGKIFLALVERTDSPSSHKVQQAPSWRRWSHHAHRTSLTLWRRKTSLKHQPGPANTLTTSRLEFYFIELFFLNLRNFIHNQKISIHYWS